MGEKHICAKCRSHKANPPANFAPESEAEPVENYVESPEAFEAEVEYPIQSCEAIEPGNSSPRIY